MSPAPYYEDDLVTLYLGDCRDVREWLAADALVTDPPYGRGWKQGHVGRSLKHSPSNAHAGIIGDADTTVRDTALDMWGTDRVAVCFGDLMLAPPAGTKQVCIYAKADGEGIRGATGGVRRDAEAIYLIGPWSSGLGGRTSLFKASARGSGANGLVARHGGHPHTKDGAVMDALLRLTPADAVIADPFAGSGSTLVAAKALGRHAIGVEVDEQYAEIAARRLAQDALDFVGVRA